MHLIDQSVGFMGSTAIVGNTIPVAVGLGLAIKLKKEKLISCVFFGDAAVEEGVFFESVNFAIVHNLPVLFICENNLYSVYSGLDVRQPKGRKIFEMVKALGIETDHGDGNKVEEVYEKTFNAKKKILERNSPQFIEFETYRHREHCGPNFDNSLGYRKEKEFLDWKERDPLKPFYENNIDLDHAIITRISEDIKEAHEFADNSEYPSEKDFLESYKI